MTIKAHVFSIIFSYSVLSILSIMGITFFITGIFEIVPFETPEDKIPFLTFTIIWTFFILISSYYSLKIPTEIHTTETGGIIFKSIISVVEITPASVNKIAYDSDGDWTLYSNNGKFNLRYFKADQLKEFFSWLLAVNSNIDNPDDGESI